MENTLNMIPILVLHGLVYGMLVFLVASGLTLVLGMMDILNFAHASMYMIGAFISYQIYQWTQTSGFRFSWRLSYAPFWASL